MTVTTPPDPLPPAEPNSPLLDVLLSGVVGALVGAVIAGAVTWWITQAQIRANVAAQKRDVLRETAAQFWAACDQLWRAQYKVGDGVFLLTQFRDDPHERQRGEQERQEGFEVARVASEEADRQLAMIRIAAPDLADVATTLRHTSAETRVHYETGLPLEGATATRAAALDDFETAVRLALDPDSGDAR